MISSTKSLTEKFPLKGRVNRTDEFRVMIRAQPTADEARRVDVLRQYAVLDTPPEQALDDLTALAAQICGVPIALISLVDEDRQWFKARIGWDIAETPRDISFCGHTL